MFWLSIIKRLLKKPLLASAVLLLPFVAGIASVRAVNSGEASDAAAVPPRPVSAVVVVTDTALWQPAQADVSTTGDTATAEPRLYADIVRARCGRTSQRRTRSSPASHARVLDPVSRDA
jgi:hypothetical protein